MKKKLFLLALIPTLLLASCGKEQIDTSKIALDYGNIHSSEISFSALEEYTYNALSSAISRKESFVLITNDEIAEHTGCGCWNTFMPIFVRFANEYHYDFKLFSTANLVGEKNDFGIYDVTGDLPGICFFRRGKLVRQTIFAKTNETYRKLFKQYDAFEKFMLDNVYLPKFYYIDKDVYDQKVASNETFNLYIARNGCGDCKEVQTKYMTSWVDKHKKDEINDLLYVFDLQPYYPPKDATEEQKKAYKDIKTEFGLSEAGNDKFGYEEGMVPTFQRRTGSTVTDMITVLNDSISKVDENFILSSYFNETRVGNSPILSQDASSYIRDGNIIDPKNVDIIEYQGETYYFLKDGLKYSWDKPIVELFFNTYVK